MILDNTYQLIFCNAEKKFTHLLKSPGKIFKLPQNFLYIHKPTGIRAMIPPHDDNIAIRKPLPTISSESHIPSKHVEIQVDVLQVTVDTSVAAVSITAVLVAFKIFNGINVEEFNVVGILVSVVAFISRGVDTPVVALDAVLDINVLDNIVIFEDSVDSAESVGADDLAVIDDIVGNDVITVGVVFVSNNVVVIIDSIVVDSSVCVFVVNVVDGIKVTDAAVVSTESVFVTDDAVVVDDSVWVGGFVVNDSIVCVDGDVTVDCNLGSECAVTVDCLKIADDAFTVVCFAAVDDAVVVDDSVGVGVSVVEDSNVCVNEDVVVDCGLVVECAVAFTVDCLKVADDAIFVAVEDVVTFEGSAVVEVIVVGDDVVIDLTDTLVANVVVSGILVVGVEV